MAVPSFLARERIVARPGFNRWLIPPAALAVHLCIGQAYATSVYKAALVKHFDTSLTAIGIIFSIAIVMLGLSAAVFGTWVDRNGPRAAMFTAACFWSAGFLVGSLGISTEPAVAGLPRLRRHRRHRPGHRLHLAGLHADQVVPRPPGPGHRHGDHGLRRRRADRLAAVAPADGPLRPRLRPGATRPRCPAGSAVALLFLTLGLVYLVFMLFGAFIVRVPADDWKPDGLRPVHGEGEDAGHDGQRLGGATRSRRRSSGCCGSCCSAT